MLHGVRRASGALRHVAELFAQSVEYARFGHAHRTGTHVQIGPNVFWGLTVDGGSPEGLPGTFLKLRAHQVRRAIEQAAFFLGRGFVVVLLRLRHGELRKLPLSVRSTHSSPFMS